MSKREVGSGTSGTSSGVGRDRLGPLGAALRGGRDGGSGAIYGFTTYESRLPRPAIPERETGSGTT